MAHAQPVPGSSIRAEAMNLYPDVNDPSIYYYPPGRIKLSERTDGSPELSFLQLRYVGTGATGDQGKFTTRSAFSFRLVMEHRPSSMLQRAADVITAQTKRRVTLKPMPITGFETHLLYTPVGQEKVDAGTGDAESLSDWSPTQYWTERVITVYPNSATSQLLWDILKRGQAAMTVTYAFTSKGASIEGAEKTEEFTALADAIPITVDTDKYPGSLKQIDLNERAPANFPLLNVYCFDFKEEREGDVIEKHVELEATGVTGRPITSIVKFLKGERDVYSARAKFKFAISMKKGYRYRVRDITADGDEKTGEWTKVNDWVRILDVTTKASDGV
jgi:hypothetical protein